MKLKELLVNGYKSIGKECKIEINRKSSVLIGKSNVGKSNILDSIDYAYNNKKIPINQRCSWNNIENDEICIQLKFEVEKNEKKTLTDIWMKLKDVSEVILIKRFNGEREFEFIPEVKIDRKQVPTEKTIDDLSRNRRKIRKQIREFVYLELENSDILEDTRIVELFKNIESCVNDEKSLHVKDNYNDQMRNLEIFEDLLLKIRKELDEEYLEEFDLRGMKYALSLLEKSITIQKSEFKFIESDIAAFDEEDLFALLPKLVHVRSDENIIVQDRVKLESVINGTADQFASKLISLGVPYSLSVFQP